MKTNVILVDTMTKWTHREIIDAKSKIDAWHDAMKIAQLWGLRNMKSHQTTVGMNHFVTIFGRRRGT